jgi:hypothetical protein
MNLYAGEDEKVDEHTALFGHPQPAIRSLKRVPEKKSKRVPEKKSERVEKLILWLAWSDKLKVRGAHGANETVCRSVCPTQVVKSKLVYRTAVYRTVRRTDYRTESV